MTLPEAIADGLQALIEDYPSSAPDDRPDPMLEVAIAFLRSIDWRVSVRHSPPMRVEKLPSLPVVGRDDMLAVVDLYLVEQRESGMYSEGVVAELRNRLRNLPTIQVDVVKE